MFIRPAEPPDGEELRLGQLEEPRDDGGAGYLRGEDGPDSQDGVPAGDPVEGQEFDRGQAYGGNSEQGQSPPRRHLADPVFDGVKDRKLAEEGDEAGEAPESFFDEDHDAGHYE